jgi:integration host factor subunit beta
LGFGSPWAGCLCFDLVQLIFVVGVGAAAVVSVCIGEGLTLIRSELVQKLCEDHPDLTVKEIERVVSAFYDSIIDQLQRGGRVELRGFGAFSTRDRDARKGRNPRTGDSVDVAAKRVPYFKPGKEMRERLNLQDVPAAE